MQLRYLFLPAFATQKKRSAGPGKNGKSAFGAVLRPFKDAVSTHKTRFMVGLDYVLFIFSQFFLL